MSVTFFQLHKDGLKIPKKHLWTMQVGVGDDGTVYAPAVCHPAGENLGFLCAGYDAVSAAFHDGHVFLPVEWLRAEIKSALEGNPAKKERDTMKQTLVSMENMELEARQTARWLLRRISGEEKIDGEE